MVVPCLAAQGIAIRVKVAHRGDGLGHLEMVAHLDMRSPYPDGPAYPDGPDHLQEGPASGYAADGKAY